MSLSLAKCVSGHRTPGPATRADIVATRGQDVETLAQSRDRSRSPNGKKEYILDDGATREILREDNGSPRCSETSRRHRSFFKVPPTGNQWRDVVPPPPWLPSFVLGEHCLHCFVQKMLKSPAEHSKRKFKRRET